MMKQLLTWGLILVLVVSLSACAAGEEVAEEEAPPVPALPEEAAVEVPEEEVLEEAPVEGEEAPVEGEEAPVEGEEAPAEAEEVTTSNVERGTRLAAYDIVNRDGEDLGDTIDMMITLKTGQIDYLVLTFGGFLGMGQQHFLVPWEAVQAVPEMNAFLTEVLTQDALEEAPTFEPDAWPDTAQPDWDAAVIAYWESVGLTIEREPVAAPEVAATPAITETPEVTATVEVTVTVEVTGTPEAEGAPAAEEEAAPAAEETPAAAEEVTVQLPRSVRLSVLLDYTVRNLEGETVGELEDLMINWPQGRVAYAVLSFGKFLGMGGKWFAIPLNAFTLNPVEQTVVLDIDPEMLEVAPGFDRENWPEAASPDWDEEIRQFWEERQRELEEMQQQMPTPEGGVLPAETPEVEVPESEQTPEAEATPVP